MTTATEAVYRGPNGILTSKLAGKLMIDMSTVRPDTMKSNGSSVLQQGAAFVECPVGGSTGPAKEGKLFGLAGGTKADVTRAMPVLETIVPPHRTCRSARVRRDDETCGQFAAVGVLAGAWRSPGDLQAAQSSCRSADRYFVRHRWHADRHERARRRDRQGMGGAPMGDTAFGLSAAKKDLATAVQFGASIHAELPVTASALACFEEAEAAGLGDADATAVSVRWSQNPGAAPKSLNHIEFCRHHTANNQSKQQRQ